jgi:hypothetical protein
MGQRPSDAPTLYERATDPDAQLAAVTILKSRFPRPAEMRWWAYRPPFGVEVVYAPTHARVIEIAQKEWGT